MVNEGKGGGDADVLFHSVIFVALRFVFLGKFADS
jgi:hypothetical protein